jgi:hypothetical protein
MQQRLAVASVLVLVLMAGASVLLIQSHVNGQGVANPSSPGTRGASSTNPSSSSTAPASSTTSGSLLTSPNQYGGGHGDDGGDHWSRCGNSTMTTTATTTITGAASTVSTTTTTSATYTDTTTCTSSTYTMDE